MGKAVIFSIVVIVFMLGLHKIFELVDRLMSVKIKEPIVVLTRLSESQKNTEMAIRSLSVLSKELGGNTAVFVLNDNLSGKNLEISNKTAEQLKNVFVGSMEDVNRLLL